MDGETMKRIKKAERILSGEVPAELNEEGKDALAVALVLLKEFKCAGKFVPEAIVEVLVIAHILGIKDRYEEMLIKMPPLTIRPRL